MIKNFKSYIWGFYIFISLLFLLLLNFQNYAQEKFRKYPPHPEPLPKLELPPVELATLSNGLLISVVRKKSYPLIDLRLLILSGESSSDAKAPGTATFVANLIGRETISLSSSDLEEAIELIGGNFSASTFPDYSIFTFTFLEEYLDDALNLVSKMILEPVFSSSETLNLKRNLYYELKRKKSDPEFVAKNIIYKVLFKGHPYEKIVYSEEEIAKLDQRSIIDFFNEYYLANNAELILTGDVPLQTATRKVSRYLNTWKSKNLKARPLPPLEPNHELRICFVDIPGTEDVSIFTGNIISALNGQDTFPFLVLNQFLGGMPTSRLFMNLRESKGYAYFAFSEIEFFKACGVLFIKAKVRPEVTLLSLKEILEELKKIRDEELPSFEIEQAKSYLIGNFPLRIESPLNLATKISEMRALKADDKHWNKYYENVMLIDSRRIHEIAQEYSILTPLVVIAGDKSKVFHLLEDFEKVEVYDRNANHIYTIE